MSGNRYNDHALIISVEQAEIICGFCYKEICEIVSESKRNQSRPNYERMKEVQTLYDKARSVRKKITPLSAHA